MDRRKKIINALTAVFPDVESIAGFIEDSESRENLQSFINVAAKHRLIDAPNEDAFKTFIGDNSRSPVNGKLDEDLTFEKLIDNKIDFLNIRLSNRGLTECINTLLSKSNVFLPRLNNTMFSRLKKQSADTPRKRDALRSFAFWIGHERLDLGDEWHYETLYKLCNKVESTVNYREGIRIAFSISSRGDMIGNDMIRWLKKVLKNILKDRGEVSLQGSWAKVKCHNFTTLYIDLPNTEDRLNSASYRNNIREAISIAHQISIQWTISGFASRNRFLSIGIAAGDFAEVSNHLLPILNVKLPQDPVIRMTDYARQCAMINEMKVILNHTPKEIELFNGETLNVWWVKELWSTLYWELTPDLLNENIFSGDSPYAQRLKHQLMFPNSIDPLPENDEDAISVFLKYPHYSALGYEIVRSLYCKKMYQEALEILRILLSINPKHITSRVTRMTIYKIFGVEAVTYTLSNMMFKRAEKEAQYICRNYEEIGEDFYYEHAMVKLAKLSTTIKMLRDNSSRSKMDGFLITGDMLLTLVDEAEEILMEGLTVSLTIGRLRYLFNCVQILKIVLKENILSDGNITPQLKCPNGKIKQYGLELALSTGRFRQHSSNFDLHTFNLFVQNLIRTFQESVVLGVFEPAMLFSQAVVYWDILPFRNVGIVKETLKALNKALEVAKEFDKKGEQIFSCVRLTGQLISPEEFIAQVETIVAEIEHRYNTLAAIEKMNPMAEISSDNDDLVLMTFHV